MDGDQSWTHTKERRKRKYFLLDSNFGEKNLGHQTEQNLEHRRGSELNEKICGRNFVSLVLCIIIDYIDISTQGFTTIGIHMTRVVW